MQIIPAIDIIDGKCVRLTQGDYARKKVYNENPLEVARMFEDNGISRLHLVDLDGAKAKRLVNHKVLETIAGKTTLSIDFGGGLYHDEDLRIAFQSGAYQVTGGSVAVKYPERFETWLKQFGPEKIILGADARNRKIAVGGWEEATGLDILDYLGNYTDKGVKYTISTDVDKDGLLEGPAVHLYRDILTKLPALKLIASGGVGKLDDLFVLQQTGVYGTIVGKAIYEGRISLKELQQFA